MFTAEDLTKRIVKSHKMLASRSSKDLEELEGDLMVSLGGKSSMFEETGVALISAIAFQVPGELDVKTNETPNGTKVTISRGGHELGSVTVTQNLPQPEATDFAETTLTASFVLTRIGVAILEATCPHGPHRETGKRILKDAGIEFGAFPASLPGLNTEAN